MLYKSGDPKLPQNYRPIAIIPLLYKLFARLLYNRLEPSLDGHQSPDQAGFRQHFSTDDHLFTTAIIQETTREWQIPVWIATLDFKKAFDTVLHSAIWESLRQQDIPECYTQLLQRIYMDQSGRVRTDVVSREFNIRRGMKQGDPLSSLLFNSVSESIFRPLKERWLKRGCGIQLQPLDKEALTNLRFADDVVLFASSLPQLKHMLVEMSQEAKHVGLELHPDKSL